MRRILLSLLVIVLILGALGAAGFAGYQFGLRQGAITSSSGTPQLPPGHPDIGPRGMFRDGPGFHHGFGGFGMMGRGIGFGFLSPLFFLIRLTSWALVIWAIYMLITRSGWRLTRDTTTTTTVNPVPPAETYTKVETTETKTE
jgi:uncharacterized membrane protein